MSSQEKYLEAIELLKKSLSLLEEAYADHERAAANELSPCPHCRGKVTKYFDDCSDNRKDWEWVFECQTEPGGCGSIWHSQLRDGILAEAAWDKRD